METTGKEAGCRVGALGPVLASRCIAVPLACRSVSPGSVLAVRAAEGFAPSFDPCAPCDEFRGLGARLRAAILWPYNTAPLSLHCDFSKAIVLSCNDLAFEVWGEI